jgi:hypothetical protein
MGFLTPNPLLAKISGKFGSMYIAQYGDKFVLKKVPEREPYLPTEAQKPVQARLVASLAYWKLVRADLALKAAYVLAAKLRGTRAIDVAKSDFLHPPTVADIDLTGYTGQPGETIEIEAADNFEVRSVEVCILELAGTVIEEGLAAAAGQSGRWSYSSRSAIPAGHPVVIQVTAADWPENTAVKRVDHICGPRS